MRIEVQITLHGCEGVEDEELLRVLRTVPDKVQQILQRPPCLCTHLEDPDLLRDACGNRVGTVSVSTKSND